MMYFNMIYFLESNDNNLDIKSFQRLGASFEAVKHLSMQLF